MKQVKRAFPMMMSVMLIVTLVSSLAVSSAFAETPYVADNAELGLATAALSPQATQNGWQKTKAGKVYYRNGAKVTGLQTIGKNSYYFKGNGVMCSADVKADGMTYFIKDNGVLLGAKSGGTYYYNTMKAMTKADSYDFATFVKARKIVKKITKKKDSKAKKLKKAFNWVMKKNYAIHRSFNPWQTNWTAIYARDHFNNKGGDCHADAAAFAYLAAAIGYKADVCLDAVTKGTARSHSWCMIGKKVYDPLFAQTKSYSGYYGATSGTYEIHPTKRYRVPQYNSKHASKSSNASSVGKKTKRKGLVKVDGSYYYYKKGKALKNKWKTIGGKRYYFKSDGRAATLSTKVKGTYYVFNEKGVLQKSKSSKARIVKIGSDVYQVNKAGKAVAGWSSDKTKRFDKTGLLLTGVWWLNGAFYAADASGVYQKGTTDALNKAAVKNAPAAELVRLLGKPTAGPAASVNCDAGFDIIRTYAHFSVVSWQSDNPATVGYVAAGDNAEVFKSVEAL